MSKYLSTVNQLPAAQDDIGSYFSKISKIPVLTKEEEQALTHELYYNNSIEAARTLILHHLRFVVYIAKNYRGYGLALPDLIQEGNVGLMKAVKNFDPNKNVRLASFAVHWIKSEINEFVIKNWKMVKVATTKEQRKLFFNLRSQKKTFNWLTVDEAQKIADDLHVSKEQVFEMESRLAGQDVSFDFTDQDEDSESSNALVPSHWLSTSESEDPAIIAEQNETSANNQMAIHAALNSLDERSREIVMKRWLDEDNKSTLQNLADEYGVSPERIRQIETQAMKKLRSHMIM
ncbi:RNA polymerase sigma factor RpoH [Ostreibacterium oceani]|uniref:RNA polymerase sigma factor n=1 Tax=Ostreibacterium oceani TaxID=2654998 RepID=A0A6N7EUN0_9GAMM|nr:RNA polymerase sigma factor RpoH [Ostreibacterium oceani]MPV86494.1 RNA polymerase sigma factor RpoH [Ostreibacterium oceani]